MTEFDTAGRRGFSSRNALLATPLRCRRSGPRIAAPADARAVELRGGLTVVRVSGMSEDERGGSAVVVLHGWGAAGDDLVPLAEALKRPGARFFIPAAPLPVVGGGRGWWHLDPSTRPPHASTDQLAPGFMPSAAVVAARSAVQALIATVVDRYAPTMVALVGFSQGAMLAIDVALAGAPGVQLVVGMSGVLLMDSVSTLTAPHATKPLFLLSHGCQDPVVPFSSGKCAKDLLEKHGFFVTWRPFEGGHEIPSPLLAEVAQFLFPPP
jgi:phospholipase/carboxylesterase